MNFTPFVPSVGSAVIGSTSGTSISLPGGSYNPNIVHKQEKLPQGFINGTPQIGQIVNLVPGTEPMQFFKTMDPSGASTAQNHNVQPQMFTLPISMPGAKPGDPQQMIQIQVLNPNLQMNQSVQSPKYQMQIPIQSFQQGGLGTTLLTVAYSQEGSEGQQIIGNTSLPEGYQVVAAIQPQDLQLLANHMPSNDVQQSINTMVQQNVLQQTKENSQHHQTYMLSNGQQLIINQPSAYLQQDTEKRIMINNINNNNNGPLVTIGQQTFRIKQEMFADDENGTPVSLQQYLKFNPSTAADVKREACETMAMPADSETDPENTSSIIEGPSEIDTKLTADEGEMTTINETEVSMIKPKKKKKYKKKPPKPKKPKPGQVVIATALDGTTLFCCPECQLAYPEKDQLESHLVGHKIERRYICGICGAGLKRKEHLERHKLGHNSDRPFTCTICNKGFKRKEHLNLHFVIHSGEKNEVCTECGKGFYRKDHLRKHMKSHAMRRSRDEMAVTTMPEPLEETANMENAVITSPDSSSKYHNVPVNNITIHVPTSSSSVPIQISVPQHLVSMANNSSQMMSVFP